jgi:hypothetical protein
VVLAIQTLERASITKRSLMCVRTRARSEDILLNEEVVRKKRMFARLRVNCDRREMPQFTIKEIKLLIQGFGGE